MVKPQIVSEYSISTYVPFALISVAGFLVVGYLTLFSFAEDAPVIVISSPWDSERQAVTRALTPASKLIRSDFDGTFVTVLPEQQDYPAKVRALGAWAVISSLGIGGCNPKPSTSYGSNI
ncbi:hypothetical protein FMN63_13495 [Stappia sp. BW2]|uniref:hypothetical protein n=1 Tax=Stappia sp. BW2 TaxID=2592622 RepID=UPI0011DED1A6|nr:hypothetical protein [Stappia sp. BW2]TYC67116.1 hypothetical protein FMN63_13495 [Stappia sp. BW2]